MIDPRAPAAVPPRAPSAGGPTLVTPPPGAGAAPSPPDGSTAASRASAAEHGLARFEPHDATHRYALLAVSADGGRIVATPDPDERTAEGYLRMTARILLEASKKPWRSIGVVSAQEGEGRTAAAVNLAVCLGRAKGRRGRVLLVDGDARYRTLSRMFCGPDAAPPADGSSPRHPMLIGTALDGVDLMTAPILEDGLTLSAPGAWMETFEELGGLYPDIVVDCPAVLDNPEGLVLRECVQHLIVVVRAGHTPRHMVKRAIGHLGERVLGVIVNGSADRAAPSERWSS